MLAERQGINCRTARNRCLQRQLLTAKNPDKIEAFVLEMPDRTQII
jgi:hypothetical protein